MQDNKNTKTKHPNRNNNIKTHKNKKKQNNDSYGIWVGLFVILLGLGSWWYIYTTLMPLRYRIESLEAQKAQIETKLTAINARLHLIKKNVDEMNTPYHHEKIARRALHMRKPGEKVYRLTSD